VIRAFIALDIDEALRTALQTRTEDLRGGVPERAVRWVQPESIHLTLKFLGDIHAKMVPDIEAGLEAAAVGIGLFRMQVAELGCFPNDRRPRVIWVGVKEESGALKTLYNALETQMAGLGFERERRKLHPHLTLGRVRRSASRSDVRDVAQALQDGHIGAIGAVDCSHVHLYQSELRPTGAVYSRLASIAFGGSP
jgi:2'-5' RNA ligase